MRLTVIDGGERLVIRAQIDERDGVLVPVDEGQFAFDAPVARVSNGRDRE
jgi:hypothetical protein